jgi:hypothetical protein
VALAVRTRLRWKGIRSAGVVAPPLGCTLSLSAIVRRP